MVWVAFIMSDYFIWLAWQTYCPSLLGWTKDRGLRGGVLEGEESPVVGFGWTKVGSGD